jgi:hypothetical protein
VNINQNKSLALSLLFSSAFKASFLTAGVGGEKVVASLDLVF